MFFFFFFFFCCRASRGPASHVLLVFFFILPALQDFFSISVYLHDILIEVDFFNEKIGSAC